MSSNEALECSTCRKTVLKKAPLPCDLCGELVCKNCEELMPEGSFAFRPGAPASLPEELKHRRYCQICHAEHVAPALAEYDEIVGRAKEMPVFFNTQKLKPQMKKKSKVAYKIDLCMDRDETIMRIAFQAAAEGYNSILDAEVTPKKLRKGAYQTTEWSGTGWGATIDLEKFLRTTEGILLVNDE